MTNTNRELRIPSLAARLIPVVTFLASTLAAQPAPPASGGESYATSAPPSTNLGWVMAANLVIWGGIALYVTLLHRKASSLEKSH